MLPTLQVGRIELEHRNSIRTGPAPCWRDSVPGRGCGWGVKIRCRLVQRGLMPMGGSRRTTLSTECSYILPSLSHMCTGAVSNLTTHVVLWTPRGSRRSSVGGKWEIPLEIPNNIAAPIKDSSDGIGRWAAQYILHTPTFWGLDITPGDSTASQTTQSSCQRECQIMKGGRALVQFEG